MSTKSRRAVVAAVSGTMLIAALGLATSGSTSAAYQDVAYARSKTVTAATGPVSAVGLALNSRMVDTGLGVSSGGDVYIWGYVGEGGTIAGTSMASATSYPPQKVPIGEKIVQVSGQIYNVNALSAAGTVYGWGAYPARDGTTSRSDNTPQRIRIGGAWNSSTAPLLDDVLTISTSEQAGAAIRQDGTVYVWGLQGYGGSAGSGAQQLSGLPDPSTSGNRPVYLKGAYTGFFVILANGDTYYWGGTSSAPGDVSAATSRAVRVTSLDPWSKSRVAAGSPWVIAADGGINMGGAILSDGSVLSWSQSGDAGRIGRRGTTGAAANRPGLVPGLSGILTMQFGFTGVVLGKNDGSLWGYGASDDITYGGLETTPAKVADKVVQYTSGQGYYLWQTKDGTFWGRGYNPRGAIGLPVGSGIPVRQVSYDLSFLER